MVISKAKHYELKISVCISFLEEQYAHKVNFFNNAAHSANYIISAFLYLLKLQNALISIRVC